MLLFTKPINWMELPMFKKIYYYGLCNKNVNDF